MKRRSVWVVEHKNSDGIYRPGIRPLAALSCKVALIILKHRQEMTGDEYRVVRYDASK